ncbi:MAG: hypothetical protein E6I82_04320 [Chloroflexi bacterium]|nr:MAG: hypothetical protein E6I82_04320 [Chloroflexota bacterium]
MAVLIAAVAGGGLLIKHAIEPVVPAALANCATSTQIAPHEFIGPQPMCITAAQKLEATITTSQGDIVVQLHPEVAPVTVNNFVVLAVHGYYNGLGFWKAEDWVVQGGDPRGDGRGGPGYSLPDETTTTPWDPGPTAAYNRFGTVTSGMEKAQVLSVTDTILSVTIKVS